MDKIVCKLNLKKYEIIKTDLGYCYNNKIFKDEEILAFTNKLIKMCHSIEKRKSNICKSNNKIEIFVGDEVITLIGIDLRVINYIKKFLK